MLPGGLGGGDGGQDRAAANTPPPAAQVQGGWREGGLGPGGRTATLPAEAKGKYVSWTLSNLQLFFDKSHSLEDEKTALRMGGNTCKSYVR